MGKNMSKIHVLFDCVFSRVEFDSALTDAVHS